MWPKSDERRVRRLFRSVQPEPVPDTLHERLQAAVEARFARPSPRRVRVRRYAISTGVILGLVCLGVLSFKVKQT